MSPLTFEGVSSEVKPSMLRLLGTGDWNTLKELINTGCYEEVINDKSEMLKVITFAVNFQVPLDVLHLMCNLNPEALTIEDTPFRLARRQNSSVKTITILEAARQHALSMKFNDSSSSLTF
mmetsp:Transcript_17770/g.20467  ORF Transcript_17770/g.20467 Transcript_17770/m.20467 type:complete len:121 (-) Transcript_17770:121-483(-)